MKLNQQSNTSKQEICDTKSSKISVLNKIHHKPLLLEKIFSYASKRAFIFPYLIEKDRLLKKKLKHSLEQINKNNSLSNEFNDNIYEFIKYRLLYEIQYSEILSKIKNELVFLDYYDEEINTVVSEIIPSMIKNYKKLIKNIFLNNKKHENINISSKKLDLFLPSVEKLALFTRDYLSIQNEIVLFMLPNNTIGKEINYFGDVYLEKEEINEDSSYLSDAIKYFKSQKINLVCLLNSEKFYENAMEIKNENINKLYFLIDYKNFEAAKIFEAIYKYLINIKHRENIKEIYFNGSFLNEIQIKENNIYRKNALEYFIEQYYLKEKEMNGFNFNFYSLEKIIFNDDMMSNEINRCKLRLGLNKIFGYKTWCKIININISKLFIIDENLMNLFKNENTNLKILHIDFENQSPFQKIFIDFYEKYLNNNVNINTITIDNIGEINYDKEVYNNIINNKSTNSSYKLFNLPKLQTIFYENNNDNHEKLKDFIDLFFQIKNFRYEGYDINNNMICFLSVDNEITTDEILGILNTNKKIVNLKLILEKIDIIFDQKNSNLSIINNNRDKNQIYYKKINNFSNLIKNFHSIKELTIDGFDFTFNEICNEDIISLNINTINNFSKNNCNCIYETKNFKSFNNLSTFSNLEKLSFSGDYSLLNDISIDLPKKIKKITFYARNSNYKKINYIKKRLLQKKVILEEILFNKNTIKEENDNYYDEYEENEDDEFDDYNEEYIDKYDEYDPFAVPIEVKKQISNKINYNNSKNIPLIQDKSFLISNIIKNDFDYEKIIKGFNSIKIKLKPNKNNFEMIYNSTCDGDNIAFFRKLCGTNIKMLLIIKTTSTWNISQKVFGCYCFFKANKNDKVEYCKRNGFFFDINSNKINPIDIKDTAFYEKDSGLCLPGYFQLSDKFLKKDSIFLEKYLILNNNAKVFRCKNVEVFIYRKK